MKTYSAEEFKKMYGEQGFKQLEEVNTKFSQPKQKGGGYFGVTDKIGDYSANAIKESFTGGVDRVKQGYNQAKNAKNPLELIEGGIKQGEGVIGATLSPFAGSVKPIGQAINYVGDKIGNMSGVQKFANSKAGEVTNRAVEDINGLNTIAGAVAGGMKSPEVGESMVNAAKNDIGGAIDGGGGAVSAVKDMASNVKEKITPAKPDRVQTAIKDATPDYESMTKPQKGKVLDRVKEGGMLEGRSVEPDAMQVEAGNELSNVPEYDPASTKLQKYQVAKKEVGRRGQELQTKIDAETHIVPKKQVAKMVVDAVNDLPNRSLLLQKSDPVIANYIRVFKNALRKEPGTLGGVFRLRKILDQAYENARGKQAFGSDKISALDDINKVARDTLTQYVIDNAKNVDVKAGMRSQWNLYRAIDELKTAAERESGSVVGRFKQNHPFITKSLKATGRAAGIGLGVNTLP